MQKKLNILTIAYLIFIMMLALSGYFSGIVSELVYYLAFIIPIAFSLGLTKKGRAEGKNYLLLNSDRIKLTLPLIAPTVSVVAIISFLTSLVMYFISGRTNNPDIGDSFILALILHALLPAIFEEILFRYLPLRLLSGHSRRATVILSAFFFALVHHNLFTIPYAFIAGLIFMAVDIAFDSIIPSIIIHFVNNAISVGLIIFADNAAFGPTVYVILGILCLISLYFILKKKKLYLKEFSSVLEKGEGIIFNAEMLLFALLNIAIAIISII